VEILIIVIVYIIYKLFSFSNEGNELENIGDVTPSLEINYENTDGSKKTDNKKNNLKDSENTKSLTFENLTEWLENPTPNRSFYSLSLVFNIIMQDTRSITTVSNKTFKALEDNKINTSVETIYENIVRLWNDSSLNTEYIKLNNNNFLHSTELKNENLRLIEKLFKNALDNQANYIFNKKKIIKDLNYLFEIITKKSQVDFL
jgi:hypothetical protein|tara:strand:- start:179 stop:787 length:609 start_codon:yes stop_codon:yes gene_type:complete